MDTRQRIMALLDHGLTQSEIAKRSGTSQPTISRFTRGVHVDIKASIADSIANLYEEVFSKAVA